MAGHDIWGTPLDFFEIVNEEFHFSLDAAATWKDTLCEKFISPEQDALITPWEGSTVRCNPPYGAGSTVSHNIAGFLQRGYEQHLEHEIPLSVGCVQVD